jgi:hypothetical protein
MMILQTLIEPVLVALALFCENAPEATIIVSTSRLQIPNARNAAVTTVLGDRVADLSFEFPMFFSPWLAPLVPVGETVYANSAIVRTPSGLDYGQAAPS